MLGTTPKLFMWMDDGASTHGSRILSHRRAAAAPATHTHMRRIAVLPPRLPPTHMRPRRSRDVLTLLIEYGEQELLAIVQLPYRLPYVV